MKRVAALLVIFLLLALVTEWGLFMNLSKDWLVSIAREPD